MPSPTAQPIAPLRSKAAATPSRATHRIPRRIATPVPPPFVRDCAPDGRQSFTAAASGRQFTSGDLKSFGRSTRERLRNALARDVFTAEELAITRFGEIVSVTLFASERTLATLRRFPPHGCDVRKISRLEAVQIVARGRTLDGMVLLQSVLGPHAQG